MRRYDALIRACAIRRDYASEAVSLYERMRAASYPLFLCFSLVLNFRAFFKLDIFQLQ